MEGGGQFEKGAGHLQCVCVCNIGAYHLSCNHSKWIRVGEANNYQDEDLNKLFSAFYIE